MNEIAPPTLAGLFVIWRQLQKEVCADFEEIRQLADMRRTNTRGK
jgi:hypothetical protein